MALTPEGRVKTEIRKYLKTLPLCWHFAPVSNGMGQAGIPDLLCVIEGRFVGIECKAPGKESNTTANQDQAINSINEAGGLAFVASSLSTVKLVLLSEGFNIC